MKIHTSVAMKLAEGDFDAALCRIAEGIFTRDQVVIVRLKSILQLSPEQYVRIHGTEIDFEGYADRGNYLRAMGWQDLTAPERAVMTLLCRDELTEQEIATRYKVQRRAVFKHKDKALDVMAQALADDALMVRALEPVRGAYHNRPGIPFALRCAVYARDGYRCRHCGVSAVLSLDHIMPYSRGGPDTYENLQTLCRPCNSRKNARLPMPGLDLDLSTPHA